MRALLEQHKNETVCILLIGRNESFDGKILEVLDSYAIIEYANPRQLNLSYPKAAVSFASIATVSFR